MKPLHDRLARLTGESRRAVIVVAVALTTTALALALFASFTRIEGTRGLAAELATFRQAASALHAAHWRVTAEHDTTPGSIRRVRDARLRFLRARQSLHDTSMPATAAGFDEAYADYVAVVDAELLRLTVDERAQASPAEAAVAERAYVVLDRQVDRLGQDLLAAEARTLGRVRLAALAGLVLGALGAVALAFGLLASQERSDERIAALSEHSTELLWVLGPDGEVRFATPLVRDTLRGQQAGAGTPVLWDAVYAHDRDLVRSFVGYLTFQQNTVHTCRARFEAADGSLRHLEIVGRNLTANESVGGLVLNASDITARIAEEDSLRHEALHDPLTSLPNPTLLADRMRATLAASGHDPGLSFAVIIIDLDGFDAINVSLGQDTADALLVAVADRLSKALRILGGTTRVTDVYGSHRPPGTDTLARIGGDKFAVFLNHVHGPTNALAAATRLQSELGRPFELEGHEVHVSASFGVTTGPGAYRNVEDMLRDADVAMMRAKTSGRGQVQMFDVAMQATASHLLALKTHLRSALEQDGFSLAYQPMLALDSRQLRGCEALIRWNHEGQSISPAEFIPLAEETGLIVPMGRWVLREACRQARVWREEFPELPSGVVHVNVSAIELVHPEFLASVDGIVGASGVVPSDVTFELTESIAMRDPERTIRIIAELQARGHKVAIDDFGTGYCSLSYFHRLSIDVLKIDRSFIMEIETSARALGAVKLIVDMARSMEIEVVAEGVETAGQATLLQAIGCHLGQGFGFAKPLPAFQLRPRLLAQQAAIRVSKSRPDRQRPAMTTS